VKYRQPGGKAGMSAWWWVAIGFTAWCGIALAVGLLLGQVLRRSSGAQKALDAQMGETPADPEKPPRHGEPPRDEPNAPCGI